jgi:hypothetical protein
VVGRLGSFFFFCLGACSKDWESAVSLIPARCLDLDLDQDHVLDITS